MLFVLELTMNSPITVEKVLQALGRAYEERIREYLRNEQSPMLPELESLSEFVDITEFSPKSLIDSADLFYKCFENVLLRFRSMQTKNEHITHTHEEFEALKKCVQLATLRECGTLIQCYYDESVDWAFGYIVVETAKKVMRGEQLQDR